MANLRLSSATAAWQCELPDTRQCWSFGFSPKSMCPLDPEWRSLIAPPLEKSAELFSIAGLGGGQWRVSSASAGRTAKAPPLLLNGEHLRSSLLQEGDILTIASEVHLMVSLELAPTASPRALISSDGRSDLEQISASAEGSRSTAQVADDSRDIGAKRTSRRGKLRPNSAAPRKRRLAIGLFCALVLGTGVLALSFDRFALARPKLLSGANSGPDSPTTALGATPPLPALGEAESIQSSALRHFAAALQNSEKESAENRDPLTDHRREQLTQAFWDLSGQFARYVATPNSQLASQLAAFQVRVERLERDCYSSALKPCGENLPIDSQNPLVHYLKSAKKLLVFQSLPLMGQVTSPAIDLPRGDRPQHPSSDPSFLASSQLAWTPLMQVIGFQRLWNALSIVPSTDVHLPQQELKAQEVLDLRVQLLAVGPERAGPPCPSHCLRHLQEFTRQ